MRRGLGRCQECRVGTDAVKFASKFCFENKLGSRFTPCVCKIQAITAAPAARDPQRGPLQTVPPWDFRLACAHTMLPVLSWLWFALRCHAYHPALALATASSCQSRGTAVLFWITLPGGRVPSLDATVAPVWPAARVIAARVTLGFARRQRGVPWVRHGCRRPALRNLAAERGVHPIRCALD